MNLIVNNLSNNIFSNESVLILAERVNNIDDVNIFNTSKINEIDIVTSRYYPRSFKIFCNDYCIFSISFRSWMNRWFFPYAFGVKLYCDEELDSFYAKNINKYIKFNNKTFSRPLTLSKVFDIEYAKKVTNRILWSYWFKENRTIIKINYSEAVCNPGLPDDVADCAKLVAHIAGGGQVSPEEKKFVINTLIKHQSQDTSFLFPSVEIPADEYEIFENYICRRVS